MAIEPIKMFQNDQSSLAQILQGGNSSLSRILDNAIQLGRDMSNKQLSQEQDLMSQRRSETALAQRKGEQLQGGFERAMDFGQRAYQFETSTAQRDSQFAQSQANADRSFLAAEEEREFDRTRMSAQDLLHAQQWNKSYELQENQSERATRSLDAADAERAKALEYDRVLGEQYLGGRSAPVQDSGLPAAGGFSAEGIYTPDTPSSLPPMSKPQARAPQQSEMTAEQMYQQGMSLRQRGASSKNPAFTVAGDKLIADAKVKEDLESEIKNDARYIRREGIKTVAKANAPESEASKRAAEGLAMRKDETYKKELDLRVKANTSAFPGSVEQLMSNYEASKKTKSGDEYDSKLEQAKREDADKLAFEVGAALKRPGAAGRQEYINLRRKDEAALPQAEKDLRGELWDYAHSLGKETRSGDAPAEKTAAEKAAELAARIANGS